MPIYFGSENISNYFPKESFIQLYPDQVNIEGFIEDVLHSQIWEKNIEAISYARNLILEKYQLFPFLHSLISYLESTRGKFPPQESRWIEIKGGDKYFDDYPISSMLNKNYHKILKKIRKCL